MITKSDALELAKVYMGKITSKEYPCVIDESNIIDSKFGWVFFYNSKLFFETKDEKYLLAGNGPIFVNKYTKETKSFGSSKPVAELVREYELLWFER